jgi:ABC-type sulfate transport system substrate-binding protein
MNGKDSLDRTAVAAMCAMLANQAYGNSSPQELAKWSYDMAQEMAAESNRRIKSRKGKP